MFRNATLLIVGAAFLLFVVAGCGGSDAQPKITNPNAPTVKKLGGNQPVPD